jgi:hypothetical protein
MPRTAGRADLSLRVHDDGRAGPWSGSLADVPMMKTADLGQLHDVAHARRLNWPPRLGGVLLERQVRPRSMVVREVRFQNPIQVLFAEDDNVIETFSTDRSDQAFGIGVLPGGPWRSQNFLDADALAPTAELLAVDTITVANHVFGRRVFWTASMICCAVQAALGNSVTLK